MDDQQLKAKTAKAAQGLAGTPGGAQPKASTATGVSAEIVPVSSVDGVWASIDGRAEQALTRKFRPKGGAEKRGVISYNMTPPSSQGGMTVQASGGVDTLDASLWVIWGLESWRELRSRLKLYQSEAREDEGQKKSPKWQCPGGGWITVEPGGGKRGNVYYTWKADFDGGISLSFQDVQSPKAAGNVALHLGAVPLTVHGHQACWDRVYTIIESLGGEIIKSTTSRIDLCVDLVGVDVQEFTTLAASRQCLQEANKGTWFTYGEKYSGFRVGEKPMLRFYDKVKELERSDLKRHLMEQHRWRCVPEKAARAEFQLRRDWLRDNSVCTIEGPQECFRRLGNLAQYLTERWFVLCEKKPDKKNKNQKRAGVHPLWEQVKSAFQWTGQPTRQVSVREAAQPDLRTLFAMFDGVATSIAAARGESSLLEADPSAYLAKLAGERSGPKILEQVREKSAALRRLGFLDENNQPYEREIG